MRRKRKRLKRSPAHAAADRIAGDIMAVKRIERVCKRMRDEGRVGLEYISGGLILLRSSLACDLAKALAEWYPELKEKIDHVLTPPEETGRT